VDESTYVDAAIPEPFTILGLRLRPLSIGHLILLHKLESPFVRDDLIDSFSIGDLALGCLICSGTYADGRALLDDEHLDRKLFQWGLRATNQHGWRIWCRWLYEAIDLKTKMSLFLDYLKYHICIPYYSVEQGKSRAIRAPAWQVIKMVLLSQTNLTESEILDRPYRLCMTDFITLRAIEGQFNFEDAEDLEELQRLANDFAETLKERN